MSLPVIIDSGPSERGWSYYASFVRCGMLFYWRYVYTDAHGQRWSDYTPALARGTLVHVGLAHHYARMWARQNRKDPDRVLPPLDAMRIAAERIGAFGQEKLPVATSMVEAYWRRYPVENFKIVAVEEPVRMHFGAALYTARLDLVIEDSDRWIRILDTKTTSRLEAKTLRKYTNHGQFFGQHYLGRATYGERFGGVIVNIVDERGECYRKPVPPSPFLMRTFPSMIERRHAQIECARGDLGVERDAWATLASPDEQICFGPYGACPALELCRWGGPG